MQELDRLFVGRVGPIEIITAEHVDKLGNLIEDIGLLPGTAVAVSAVP